MRTGPHLPGCLALRDPRLYFFTPCTCHALAPLYALDFARHERATLRLWREKHGDSWEHAAWKERR